MGDNRRRKEDDKLIRRRGNNQVLSADIFSQLETRHHFPFEVLSKKLVGFVCVNMIYLLYEDGPTLIKVPFARNRLWFRAIISDPGFSALSQLPQVYVVSKRD